MNEILTILWDWLHWIIFGVGCMAIIGLIIFFRSAWNDKRGPETEEELLRREKMAMGDE